MIRKIDLKPFDKFRELPLYVFYKAKVNKYFLTAKVLGGYVINLAELHLAELENSNGEYMAQVIFKSYTNHGEKMIETKSRVDGLECQFIAVMNAMINAGIIFDTVTPCHFLDLLNALGARYQADNPDILNYSVMSQMCH